MTSFLCYFRNSIARHLRAQESFINYFHSVLTGAKKQDENRFTTAN
jgi:hypothetical protein